MKPVYFVNKVIKQGNSLCVRIPNQIVKEQNLEKGDEILVNISKVSYEYDPDAIEHLLEISNKIPALDKYSKTQKRLFVILNFDYLENLDKKENWFGKKNKEFGKEFMDIFLEFERTFQKEAFIEEEGVYILKEKYR